MLGDAHPQSRHLQRSRERDQVGDVYECLESNGPSDYVTGQNIHTVSAQNRGRSLLLSDTYEIGRVCVPVGPIHDYRMYRQIVAADISGVS